MIWQTILRLHGTSLHYSVPCMDDEWLWIWDCDDTCTVWSWLSHPPQKPTVQSWYWHWVLGNTSCGVFTVLIPPDRLVTPGTPGLGWERLILGLRSLLLQTLLVCAVISGATLLGHLRHGWTDCTTLLATQCKARLGLDIFGTWDAITWLLIQSFWHTLLWSSDCRVVLLAGLVEIKRVIDSQF